MKPLPLFLNILWVLFGGLWMAIAWLVAGAIMVVTIIGIPWARAAFNMASYAFLPFGRRAMSRAVYQGYDDLGTGPAGTLGNLIWLVLAGWWLALGHLAIALCQAATIIGLPFAWAHLKLAGLALWPIGRIIVPIELPPVGYVRGR